MDHNINDSVDRMESHSQAIFPDSGHRALEPILSVKSEDEQMFPPGAPLHGDLPRQTISVLHSLKNPRNVVALQSNEIKNSSLGK